MDCKTTMMKLLQYYYHSDFCEVFILQTPYLEMATITEGLVLPIPLDRW